MSFKSKIVVVTGAASGIGKLLSEEFSKEGALVMMFDVDEKNLENCSVDNAEKYIVDLRNKEQI